MKDVAVKRDGDPADRLLGFDQVWHLQVPGTGIRSSSRIRRVGYVVVYKVANMVAATETVQE